MEKIKTPDELHTEVERLLTVVDRPEASELDSLAHRVEGISWTVRSETDEGFKELEAVDGNVTLHVKGFARGPRREQWEWACSGEGKERKGKGRSESEAKLRCETAAKKVTAGVSPPVRVHRHESRPRRVSRRRRR